MWQHEPIGIWRLFVVWAPGPVKKGEMITFLQFFVKMKTKSWIYWANNIRPLDIWHLENFNEEKFAKAVPFWYISSLKLNNFRAVTRGKCKILGKDNIFLLYRVPRKQKKSIVWHWHETMTKPQRVPSHKGLERNKTYRVFWYNIVLFHNNKLPALLFKSFETEWI